MLTSSTVSRELPQLPFGIDKLDARAEQALIDRRLTDGIRHARATFCRYTDTALVLGRGQRPTQQMLVRASQAGVEVVRRHSGGGAVLTGPWMLGFCLFLPPGHVLLRASMPSSYVPVGTAWQRALAGLGISARAVGTEIPPDAATPGWDWVCFGGLSHGELADARGRKILGLAQVRRKGGMAMVGGVLLGSPPWETLLSLWSGRRDSDWIRSMSRRAVGIDSLGDDPVTADVVAGRVMLALTEARLID